MAAFKDDDEVKELGLSWASFVEIHVLFPFLALCFAAAIFFPLLLAVKNRALAASGPHSSPIVFPRKNGKRFGKKNCVGCSNPKAPTAVSHCILRTLGKFHTFVQDALVGTRLSNDVRHPWFLLTLNVLQCFFSLTACLLFAARSYTLDGRQFADFERIAYWFFAFHMVLRFFKVDPISVREFVCSADFLVDWFTLFAYFLPLEFDSQWTLTSDAAVLPRMKGPTREEAAGLLNSGVASNATAASETVNAASEFTGRLTSDNSDDRRLTESGSTESVATEIGAFVTPIYDELRLRVFPFWCLTEFLLLRVHLYDGPASRLWLSLSFLRAKKAFYSFQRCLDVLPRKSVVGREWFFLRFEFALECAALTVVWQGMILVLEVLGEPPFWEEPTLGKDSNMSYIQMWYFVFTTITTVGYGDFSPKHWLSRLFLCYVFVHGIAFFAEQSAKLFELNAELWRGKGHLVAKKRGEEHVLITGSGVGRANALLPSLLEELCHPEHGRVTLSGRFEVERLPRLVFLCEHDITEEFREFVYSSVAAEVRPRVSFFQGSVEFTLSIE